MTAPEIDEALIERRMKVLTLRNAGATFSAIAGQVGVSVATARKDLARAYRYVLDETPEDMLARQRAVLMDLTRANYPAALRGDKDAGTMILRFLEQEAKLFGLYAPTRVLAAVGEYEFAEQASALIESITAIDPSAFKELETARDHARARQVIDGEVGAPDADDHRNGGDLAGVRGDDAGTAGVDPAPAQGAPVPQRDTPRAGGAELELDPEDAGDDGWSNL